MVKKRGKRKGAKLWEKAPILPKAGAKSPREKIRTPDPKKGRSKDGGKGEIVRVRKEGHWEKKGEKGGKVYTLGSSRIRQTKGGRRGCTEVIVTSQGKCKSKQNGKKKTLKPVKQVSARCNFYGSRIKV